MADVPPEVDEAYYAELLEMVDTLRPAKFYPHQGWEIVKRAMVTHLEEAGFKYNAQTNTFVNLVALREKAKQKNIEQAKAKQQQQMAALKAKQAAQAQAAKAKAEKKARAEQKKTVLTGANVKWEIKQPGHIVSKGAPKLKDSQQGHGRLAQGIKHITLKDTGKQQSSLAAKVSQSDGQPHSQYHPSATQGRMVDPLRAGETSRAQQKQQQNISRQKGGFATPAGHVKSAQLHQPKTSVSVNVSNTKAVKATTKHPPKQPAQLLSTQSKYQMQPAIHPQYQQQKQVAQQPVLSPTSHQHQQLAKQQQQQRLSHSQKLVCDSPSVQQAARPQGSLPPSSSPANVVNFPPYPSANQSLLGVTLDEIQQVLSGSQGMIQGAGSSAKTPMDEGALKKITDFLQDGLSKGTDKGVTGPANQQTGASGAKRQPNIVSPRAKSPVSVRTVNPRGPVPHHSDLSRPLDLSTSSQMGSPHPQPTKSPGGSSYALDLSKGTLHTILTTTASQTRSFTPSQMTTAVRQQQQHLQQQQKLQQVPQQHQQTPAQPHLMQQHSPVAPGLQHQGSPPKTLVGNFVGASTVPLANTVTITEAIPLYAVDPQKTQVLTQQQQSISTYQQPQAHASQQHLQQQSVSLASTAAQQPMSLATQVASTHIHTASTLTQQHQQHSPQETQEGQPTQPLSVKLPTGQVLNLQVLNVPMNSQQVLAGQSAQLQVRNL